MGDPDPTALICAKTERILFHQRSPRPADWADSFRSWPTIVPGWRDSYRRVSAAYSTQWGNTGIARCIKLSLADYPRNDPLLSAACYFCAGRRPSGIG